MELSKAQVAEIVRKMRAAGFDVTSGEHEGSLAFTCPKRSRLMFGAVIADVLSGWPYMVPAMLKAGQTSYDPETRELTLFFPGYTAGA
jgi:hypothetical protein